MKTEGKKRFPSVVEHKSVYEFALEHDIRLNQNYVIIEKSKDGKSLKLLRIPTFKMLVEKTDKIDAPEFVTDTIEHIKSYMYNYGFKVLNGELSKDNRLIIKKFHFPVVAVAYFYTVYFYNWKFAMDESYYRKVINERLEWLCKPYGNMVTNYKNNFEVDFLDKYFPQFLSYKDVADMLKMSKTDKDKFIKYMFEDVVKMMV